MKAEREKMLGGSYLFTDSEEKDKEEEDNNDENSGCGGRASPAYGERSSHFGVLEAAAEEWQRRRGVSPVGSEDGI